MSEKTRVSYEFEDFRLDGNGPSLWRVGEHISMPPKAVEVLYLLVKKKGEIVSREELIETVWKDTFVEEGNINYTVSLLRKIFDNKNLIKTVTRRGYRFTAPVTEIEQSVGPAGLRAAPILFAEPESHKQTRPRRRGWAFAPILLVGALFATSVAYFLEPEQPMTPSAGAPAPASEAMHSYLRGKMILQNRSVENRDEKAIDEFQRAVGLDPTLAIAYAGLAEGFASSAVRLSHPASKVVVAKAKTAADKALTLEPNLAEGYMIRGWIKRNFDWDWEGAEADLRRSIELSPKNADAHQRLSQTLSVVGRQDEALAESMIAHELDPVSENIIMSRFSILDSRGDYEEGLSHSESYLRENKNSNPAARAHATFLYHTRDYQKVIDLAENSLEKQGSRTPFAWLSLLAAAYHNSNQPEKAAEALARLETLSQTDSKALYSLAMNYAELGRIDEAMTAIQRCYERREERMSWVKVEPRFASLRDDARFRGILKKMNL